jgi:hypothetical protein
MVKISSCQNGFARALPIAAGSHAHANTATSAHARTPVVTAVSLHSGG